ncbi:hypothetical protein [cf. Phormidesmis sp. LEGE 11477]|uniref:hypothetical protein n=1 Tax=cf. Phormidesmis sp. LEGE 11477 TaxID=1828680 RepID=UPI00187E4B1B|nr:hypothetical protein [cf. Phormidesmis sp. LEGE 11477]MBE9060912.1 hypothetical protein [cf. Phormidesmis sp. LEGE 11477]
MTLEILTEVTSDAWESWGDHATDSWDTTVDAVSDTREDLTAVATDTWDSAIDIGAAVREGVVAFAEDPKGTTVEFVTEDVPEWLAENESTVNRVAGSLQALGGVGETALGMAIVPTGVGTFGTTSVLGAGGSGA